MSRSSSYLARLLVPVWQRTRADAASVPAAAWRRWAAVLAAGYAVTWVVIVVSVQTARALLDQGLQAWDERLLHTLADSAFSFSAGLWFEAWGSSAFLVPMLLVALILLLRAGYLFRAVTLLLAYLSVKSLVLGAWQLWDRARPEMIAEGIAAPGLHSFPSGHAVNSVVMFGLLGWFWWRASRSVLERVLLVLVVLLVTALTCLGRVRLGTHWPSDIIAGMVIGSSWLATLAAAIAVAEGAMRRRQV